MGKLAHVDDEYRKQRIEDASLGISEGILKLLVGGGALGLALLAPNIVQVLDKPIARYFAHLDKRAQERELRRALSYVKRKGWVASHQSDYEYGLQITADGKRRLKDIGLEKLSISRPKVWDRRWRLVFFDIPEQKRSGRRALTHKLKALGFYMLQRSVFVHPYPCRAEIEQITAAYDVAHCVSYIETNHIDQQDLLIKRFPQIRQK